MFDNQDLKLVNMNIYFIASVLTGIFLYSPLLFANTIQDAFAMGVGMHYSQYLALVIPINIRRLSQGDRANKIQLLGNNTILKTNNEIEINLNAIEQINK